MPALASHSENWPEPSHGFAYHPWAEHIYSSSLGRSDQQNVP